MDCALQCRADLRGINEDTVMEAKTTGNSCDTLGRGQQAERERRSLCLFLSRVPHHRLHSELDMLALEGEHVL